MMQGIRVGGALVLAVAATALGGCFFVYIPGSVISSASDAITGAEGSNCVGEGAKVGDAVALPGGGRGEIKSLSGKSSRCTNPQLPIRASITPQATAASTSALSLSWPAGWEQQPLTDSQRASGGILYGLDRTDDTGALLFAGKRESVTDMMAFANARRARQFSGLTEATQTEIEQLVINGRSAFRYQITGTVKAGTRFTYMTTIIEGPKEIALLIGWTSAANFDRQRSQLASLAGLVSGL